MVDSKVAICLSFVNLLAWGSWPSIRTRCRCEGPVFIPLHLTGQFLTAVFLSFAIDGAKTFSSLQALVASWGVGSLILGGFFVVNGDFLCSCAMSHVPGSIAFPVYTGFCMVLGMIMTYFVEAGDSSAVLLFTGVATALCAVICLAMADAVGHQGSETASSYHLESGNNVPLEGMSSKAPKSKIAGYFTLEESVPAESQKQHVTEQPSKPEGAASSAAGILAQINPWLYVCLLGGTLCSTWSPLSNIGRLVEGGASHSYVALLLFESGQLAGLPILLTYASAIARRQNAGTDSPDAAATPLMYLRRTAALPAADKAWGLLAGAVIGLGYTMYFTASSHGGGGGGDAGEEAGGVGATLALGIASCEPLAAIILGITIDGVLRGAPPVRGRLMGFAAALFVVAISLMVASA